MVGQRRRACRRAREWPTGRRSGSTRPTRRCRRSRRTTPRARGGASGIWSFRQSHSRPRRRRRFVSFMPSAGTATTSSSSERSATAGKPETVVWRNGTARRGPSRAARAWRRRGPARSRTRRPWPAPRRSGSPTRAAGRAGTGARRSGSRRRAGSSAPAGRDRAMSSMLSESMPTSAAPASSEIFRGLGRQIRIPLEVGRRAPVHVPSGPDQHRLAPDSSRPANASRSIARPAGAADHDALEPRQRLERELRTDPSRRRSGGTASRRRCPCSPPSRSCRSGIRPPARSAPREASRLRKSQMIGPGRPG